MSTSHLHLPIVLIICAKSCVNITKTSTLVANKIESGLTIGFKAPSVHSVHIRYPWMSLINWNFKDVLSWKTLRYLNICTTKTCSHWLTFVCFMFMYNICTWNKSLGLAKVWGENMIMPHIIGGIHSTEKWKKKQCVTCIVTVHSPQKNSIVSEMSMYEYVIMCKNTFHGLKDAHCTWGAFFPF